MAAMNIQNLKSVILSLSDTLRAAGASAAATDLRKLETAFSECPDSSAISAVVAIETQLNKQIVEKRVHYVVKLKASGTNKAEFEQIAMELSGDRLMELDDVAAIAADYIGASKRWRSKPAVMQSIKEKFSERAYLESKMRLLEKTT
jgi:hypothetical protein